MVGGGLGGSRWEGWADLDGYGCWMCDGGWRYKLAKMGWDVRKRKRKKKTEEKGDQQKQVVAVSSRHLPESLSTYVAVACVERQEEPADG